MMGEQLPEEDMDRLRECGLLEEDSSEKPYPFVSANDGADEVQPDDPLEDLHVATERIIEWCPALENPAGAEQQWNYVTPATEKGPLRVIKCDTDGIGCAFCNGPAVEAERGIVEADYGLYTEDWTLVGFTCETCIHQAPETEFSEPEPSNAFTIQAARERLRAVVEYFR